jgi:hypothetical protein
VWPGAAAEVQDVFFTTLVVPLAALLVYNRRFRRWLGIPLRWQRAFAAAVRADLAWLFAHPERLPDLQNRSS